MLKVREWRPVVERADGPAVRWQVGDEHAKPTPRQGGGADGHKWQVVVPLEVCLDGFAVLADELD